MQRRMKFTANSDPPPSPAPEKRSRSHEKGKEALGGLNNIVDNTSNSGTRIFVSPLEMSPIIRQSQAENPIYLIIIHRRFIRREVQQGLLLQTATLTGAVSSGVTS
jgi:hypothetical protein